MEKQQQVKPASLETKNWQAKKIIIDGKKTKKDTWHGLQQTPQIDGVVYVETNRVLTAGDQSRSRDYRQRRIRSSWQDAGGKKRADESAQASRGNKPGGRPASRTAYRGITT